MRLRGWRAAYEAMKTPQPNGLVAGGRSVELTRANPQKGRGLSGIDSYYKTILWTVFDACIFVERDRNPPAPEQRSFPAVPEPFLNSKKSSFRHK
jgi:hypothetical protein